MLRRKIVYFGCDVVWLYSYDVNTTSSVRFTVTAPDGYGFALSSFQA